MRTRNQSTILFFAWCAMMVAVIIGLAHEPAFASFGVVSIIFGQGKASGAIAPCRPNGRISGSWPRKNVREIGNKLFIKLGNTLRHFQVFSAAILPELTSGKAHDDGG